METVIKTCVILAPQLTSCSHGVCNNSTGICNCNKGWSGVGDYIYYSENMDCDLNDDAINKLNIITLVFGCIVVCSFLNYFSRLELTYSMEENLGILYQPRIMYRILFLINSICICIVSVLKLIDPVFYRIGFEIAVTIAQAIAGTLYTYFK
jgi:hypothetical protein